MRDFSNLDGEVIDYSVYGGDANLRSNPREEFFADADGYSLADNECPGDYSSALGDKYATFMDLPSFKNADGDYSNAGGLLRKFKKATKGSILDKNERARRRGRREARQDERQARKTERVMSKSQARTTKADAQKLASESLGKESQSDIALAQALSQPVKPVEKKGLSTGAIVGITLGGLAVVGIITYFVIKSKNKGK
jgi:hypothetical protein